MFNYFPKRGASGNGFSPEYKIRAIGYSIPNGLKPFGVNLLNSDGLYARREATVIKTVVIESWLFTAKTFTDVVGGLTRI
ncbi:MAG: hypothetical protein ACO1PI_06970 [Bacteroidota bacterium]